MEEKHKMLYSGAYIGLSVVGNYLHLLRLRFWLVKRWLKTSIDFLNYI